MREREPGGEPREILPTKVEQKYQVIEQTGRTRDRIERMGTIISQAAGDVQSSTKKGITPEAKLKMLQKIEEITGTALEQVFTLLDQEGIAKTVSSLSRDSLRKETEFLKEHHD